MLKEIINELKKERIKKGITLEELSASCGVSIKHISNIENYKSTPTIETLQKLANSLGVFINISVKK